MIRRAVERPVATLLAVLAAVGLGSASLLRLPVSLLPTLERPTLTVLATAPGTGRDAILERLTRPLEQHLGALPGVAAVESTTGDGYARVRIESEWQTDADRLRLEAERRLADLEAPGVHLAIEVAPADPEPLIEVAVFARPAAGAAAGAAGGDAGAARSAFTRAVLAPELGRLPGAGKIEILGLAPLRPVVRPEAAALAARGLTAADLAARLKLLGAAANAGRARVGAIVRPLVVREDATSLAALRAVRLAGPGGESFLGDVARVDLEEVRDETAFRLAGREGALVRVYRAPEANAVALAARVRERVAALGGGGARAGSPLQIEVVADRSAEVREALAGLGEATFLGLGLGVALLRLLLGRWRPTLALAIAIPASLLAAFSCFRLAGLSLDIVSLAGLALAAGLLVDGSIVVLEAIETARSRGLAEPEIAGTRQIALPVAAGFLATAVVFLPLTYLQGLARAFFGAQAFAIVSALAAALLFSLTATPVLVRGARRACPAGEEGGSGAVGRSPGRGVYLRLLDRVLARPAAVVLPALAVSALAVAAFLFLPRELVPTAASRDLVVRYHLPPDLAPDAARAAGREVEARALSALGPALRPATYQLVALPGAGSAPDLPRDESADSGRLDLRFADPAAAARAGERLRQALRLPGIGLRIEPRASAFVEAIERTGGRLDLVATAPTPEGAQALARRAAVQLARAGLRETEERGRLAGGSVQRAVLLLDWDAPRLAALGAPGAFGGLDAERERLEEQVRDGLGELSAGRARIEGAEPEILLRPTAPGQPEILPVSTATAAGRVVPLVALARLTDGAREPALERADGLPAVLLSFEAPAGRDALRADPAALVAAIPRANGEELALRGGSRELLRAFDQLRLALALSLVLVFLAVAALYESLALPLVIMSTVPVALGGALGLLAVSGQSLNVLSFLGLILLAGIVVNNAIVLVHRAEDHRRSGLGAEEALRRAGAERYRPILMTTLATLCGMLPLAVLGGSGVELRRALALAVLGGTATSIFASLLLVPVLYRAACHRGDRRENRG
jgi:hydrophobic/amphiphilic exporter-1 (mainly G- bacteria), HAE1 family